MPPSSSSKQDESPLAGVLDRDERASLVLLVGSAAAAMHTTASSTVNNPAQSRSISWFEKWQEHVIRRVSEAANTRWEPLKTAKPRDWDELSWDEPAANESSKGAREKEADEQKEKENDTSLHHLYPPIPTPLTNLPREKRIMVLHSMLLILLSLKHYYAPSRVLMLHLASSLNLPSASLDGDERETAATLLTTAKKLSAQEEVDAKAKQNQTARRWKVGLASVAGAAVIGITGGLAAPLVAAGLGTVLGGLGLGATAAAGLLGSLAGSSVLVGGLFGAYGAKMTSGMVDQYAKEVEDFKFLPLGEEPVRMMKRDDDGDQAQRRLRVTIAVSGWLNDEQEVVLPWRVLGDATEVFALRWELETLVNLGEALKSMVTSAAWNYAKMEVLKQTVFASLLGAVMLPMGLLKLGSMVDNPFRVAKSKADKAGAVLADALVNRAQGERPVSLIGYSLGARVIHSCLLNLQKRKAYGLVDSVVLIGAPIPSNKGVWQTMKSVVAGRLINVYSSNDYVLGFLYRANSVQAGIAGLQKIEAIGVENKDVSDVVDGHLKYKALIGRILSEVGWEDVDEAEIALEQELFRAMEAQEKENQRKIEENTDRTEKEELIASMETKQELKHDDSITTPPATELRPPEMPPRPSSMPSSPGIDEQFSSMNIKSASTNAPPVQRKQLPRRNSRQQQQQPKPQVEAQQGSLIDFGDDPLSSTPHQTQPTPPGYISNQTSATQPPAYNNIQPTSTFEQPPPMPPRPIDLPDKSSNNNQSTDDAVNNYFAAKAEKKHQDPDKLIATESTPAKGALVRKEDTDDESEDGFGGGIQMVDNDPDLL